MQGTGLAIIAGRGALPRLLAEDCASRGRTYRVVTLPGVDLDWTEGHPVLPAVFEKPGRLFSDLHKAGCTEVAFAGGIARPELNPMRFDLTMLRHAPKVIAGLRGGDDRGLRIVAEIFESEGLKLVSAQSILADLLAPAGIPTRAQPTAADRADAIRAAEIVAALGAADVGQGVVVAQGICLGLESIQGTDALLDFVARTGAGYRPDPSGARGLLYKAPKPGQDLRLDLPAIGPDTLRSAARAGLAGVVVAAGGVQILGMEETLAAADATGLFLWGREA